MLDIDAIVEAIWSDLTGRAGIGDVLESCDDDIQDEIKASMADIIRKALG